MAGHAQSIKKAKFTTHKATGGMRTNHMRSHMKGTHRMTNVTHSSVEHYGQSMVPALKGKHHFGKKTD